MNIGKIIFRIIYPWLFILACLIAPFVDTAGAGCLKTEMNPTGDCAKICAWSCAANGCSYNQYCTEKDRKIPFPDWDCCPNYRETYKKHQKSKSDPCMTRAKRQYRVTTMSSGGYTFYRVEKHGRLCVTPESCASAKDKWLPTTSFYVSEGKRYYRSYKVARDDMDKFISQEYHKCLTEHAETGNLWRPVK